MSSGVYLLNRDIIITQTHIINVIMTVRRFCVDEYDVKLMFLFIRVDIFIYSHPSAVSLSLTDAPLASEAIFQITIRDPNLAMIRRLLRVRPSVSKLTLTDTCWSTDELHGKCGTV